MIFFSLSFFIIFARISFVISQSSRGSSCTVEGEIGVCATLDECPWAEQRILDWNFRKNLVICEWEDSTQVICCKNTTIAKTTIPPFTEAPRTETIFLSTTPPRTEAPSTILLTTTPPRTEEPPTTPPLTVPPVTELPRTVSPTTEVAPKEEPPTTLRPTAPPSNKRISEVECEKIKNINIPTKLNSHITHGHSVKVGEFPHMAALGYANADFDGTHYKYDCDGTLISDKFVLSAARCAKYKFNSPVVVRLGRSSIDLKDKLDTNAAQDISIEKIHKHPKFTPVRKYNDVILLELASKAVFSNFIQPACLYTSSELLSQELAITGWGRMNADTQDRPQWMLKASVKETPLNQCKSNFSSLGKSRSLSEGIVKSQICALGLDSNKMSNACQGGLDGPLSFRTEQNDSEQNDVHYVVGVHSFGDACSSKLPSVYTRVSEILDWIEPIVWPKKVGTKNVKVQGK